MKNWWLTVEVETIPGKWITDLTYSEVESGFTKKILIYQAREYISKQIESDRIRKWHFGGYRIVEHEVIYEEE